MSEFNDDVFEYGNGFSQCISGHGRATMEAILDATKDAECAVFDFDDVKRIQWHIDQLVTWCRAFNRENHRLKTLMEDRLPFSICDGLFRVGYLMPASAFPDAAPICHACASQILKDSEIRPRWMKP